MTRLSDKALMVLKVMRDSTEGDEMTLASGEKWASIYLDNALGKLRAGYGMSPRSFAGYLSTLTRQGFYKSFDDDKSAWGEVRLN